MGDEYQIYIDQGEVIVKVTEYDGNEYTYKEAEALYFEEQEERDELMTLLYSLAKSTQDPKDMIALLISELTNQSSFNEGVIRGFLDREGFNPALSQGVISAIEGLGFDLFLKWLNNKYIDLDSIEEGSYVTIKIKLEVVTAGYTKNMIVEVRLIEKNGMYVYDEKNPLCFIVPDFY